MKCHCRKFPVVVSVIAVIIGILVIVGWIFGITFFKSVFIGLTPMKFVTAICFVLTGLILFVINKIIHNRGKDFGGAPVVLAFLSLVLVIFPAIIFTSIIFQIPVGIEKIFVESVIHRETDLQPSSASMLNFIIIAIVGIVAMLKTENFGGILKASGIMVGLIGLVSIIGHLFNIPMLYYEISGISFAMAVISGPLFVLVGCGLFTLGKCEFLNKE